MPIDVLNRAKSAAPSLGHGRRIWKVAANTECCILLAVVHFVLHRAALISLALAAQRDEYVTAARTDQTKRRLQLSPRVR